MVNPQDTDLLIAPPGLPDPRFKDTVLMLTHHHDQGSFALCVNRESHHTLQDLIKEVDLELDCELNFPLYWGGPMSPTTIWMLHSSEWSIEGVTVSIDDQWSMTSNMGMFQHIADGDYPQHFRIMYGYCSWARDQLVGELAGRAPWRKEHSWLVAHNLGPEWLFEQPIEDLWTNATTLCSHQAVDSWF
jgi:putative transcriptional regulator